MKNQDVFRPTQEPARTLYDALTRETSKREGRTTIQWQQEEVFAVWRAATYYAALHGCTSPTIRDVVQADNRASGHVDYAAKLSYGVAAIMAENP